MARSTLGGEARVKHVHADLQHADQGGLGSEQIEQFRPRRASDRFGFSERTFPEERGNDEVAPVPAIRLTIGGRLKSTHNGRSLRLTLSICLALLFEIQ